MDSTMNRRQRKLESRRKKVVRTAQKPVSKFHFDGRDITFTVEGGAKIRIHSDLVFEKSPYLRRILRIRGGRYETNHEDRTLGLNAMQSFAEFCIRGKINDFTGSEKARGNILREMVDLWYLAEKLECNQLQNLAILKATEIWRRPSVVMVVNTAFVEEIYNKTKDDPNRHAHPLRRLIVELHAWMLDSTWMDFITRKRLGDLQTEFLIDMILQQSRKVGDNKIKHEDPCLHPKDFSVPVRVQLDSDSEDEEEQEVVPMTDKTVIDLMNDDDSEVDELFVRE